MGTVQNVLTATTGALASSYILYRSHENGKNCAAQGLKPNLNYAYSINPYYTPPSYMNANSLSNINSDTSEMKFKTMNNYLEGVFTELGKNIVPLAFATSAIIFNKNWIGKVSLVGLALSVIYDFIANYLIHKN